MTKILYVNDNCPVCGSECLENYLKTNLTTFFFPLPTELINMARKEPFQLKICQKCSFIFQVNVKADTIELIYSEFYKHYNLDTSVEFQEVYRERTLEFMKNILDQTIGSTAFDLGCGEGTYFPFFESLGFRCYGIEPSEKAIIAKKKNPNASILQIFFDNLDSNEFNLEFDVILLNWVLEHIGNLDAFFEKLNRHIKVGTKLIIQVPDIQYYVDNHLPLFYVHEHINYFTNVTLTLLLERKGFDVIGRKFGSSPSIIICGVYNGIQRIIESNHVELFNAQKMFLLKNDHLQEKITKILTEYENIVFYGMGLLAFWIGDNCLDNVELKKVELVDDNEFYQDKWVPLFNKKLRKFPIGYNFDNTLILICTSPVYHKKLLTSIRNKYIGNYKLAMIKNSNLVVE